MINSEIHKFEKPEKNDDVLGTIDSLSKNFEKLDKLIDEKADVLNTFLVTNKTYEVGKKIWNNSPEVGSNVGWINLRTGKFAQTRQNKKTYNIGDMVISNANNGHLYICTESGTSGLVEPLLPVSSQATVFDHSQASLWTSNYVYEIDDVVLANNGSELYYYKCTKSGVSGVTEPSWPTVSGATITDATTIWQAYKTVKWKEAGVSCDFKPFGLIY